jgi:transposase
MPVPKKYPDEVRERAVRMVFEIREETGQQQGAIARVADRLGVNRKTLPLWVRQAELDAGQGPGMSSVDSQRIAELEPEVRELRRANEILPARQPATAQLRPPVSVAGWVSRSDYPQQPAP